MQTTSDNSSSGALAPIPLIQGSFRLWISLCGEKDENGGDYMTADRILDWAPAAVVFDCDGTLVDTESHWQEARLRTFHMFGLKQPAGFTERAKGVHYADCGALMAEESGKPDLVEELTEGLLRNFMRLVADEPVTMPGAAALVRLLAGRLPLAVASNCPEEVVRSCLERTGLLKHFDHVVVAGGEVRPKPWPDVYASAARLCGVPPQHALAVEDSTTGIESARAAGLRVLAAGPVPAGAHGADLWVESLADPRLPGWARAQPVRR